MARKPIPQETVTKVLLESRRRCCICFGLHRDIGIKPGQIAHINQDNSNNSLENLAFLCLDHHDEYDSKTSQRKGLSKREVEAFRDELYSTVFNSLQQKVKFGVIELPPDDPYAGKWVRVGSGTNSSELNIVSLPNSIEGNAQYFISGFAIRQGLKPEGTNMGSLEELGEMHDDGVIVVSHRYVEDFTTFMTFEEDLLLIREEGESTVYGFGVTLEGTYKRA